MINLELEIDLRVYSLDAAKKTAYRFSDRANASFRQTSEHLWVIEFSIKQNSTLTEAEVLSELLDQDLREQVAEETKMVRDLLMAQAFSKLSLVDPVGESGTLEDDALGIVVSR